MWIIFGFIILYQFINSLLDKWLWDEFVLLDFLRSLMRIFEYVFKGRDCCGVYIVVFELEFFLILFEISILVMVLMKFLQSGEFVFLSFK